MSIEQTDKVDMIHEQQQKIFLVISDDMEWDKQNKKLLKLQDKLNAYMRFIESGELDKQCPAALHKTIEIRLICKHEPTQDGHKFLGVASQIIRNSGCELSIEFPRGEAKSA
ncbi:DUF6572 domain-containing protein [Vibrio olivae]|uniref:DUF6572 domain-containing protein n=1 Tax=Vibrio olivae TaxID=1243002 RepID=A0ABV5HUN1_9VIBR